MPKITVLDRSGVETLLVRAADTSAMEAIRSGGIDDLAAICGG